MDDDVALEAIADERLSTKVRDVQIRHIATYRQGAHGESELSVTMVKKMSPRQRRENRTTWVVGSQSHPVTSYEASIKSLRAEDLFMENRAMCIGQRASWDCDILEEAGVFEAICRPALGMIASLDDVGTFNNNEQPLTARNAPNDTAAAYRQRPGEVVFW